MRYSGDTDDVCSISCTPVKELKHPVGFDPTHAFECEDIVQWITKSRNSDPLTGKELAHTPVASVLHPLVIDGKTDHLMETRIILNQAGWVVNSEIKTVALFSDSCRVVPDVYRVTGEESVPFVEHVAQCDDLHDSRVSPFAFQV